MEDLMTRKDEEVFSTNDPAKMIGFYLAEDLKRSWTEDFVDEDTSEVVQIERFDVIDRRGTLITNEKASEYMFYIQSGDIKEVKCSNQSRKAILSTSSSMMVWSVSVQIEKKRHRFLLYAQGINQALEIVKDYVELHYEGRFMVRSAKEFTACIFIQDRWTKMNEVGDEVVTDDGDQEKTIDKHFYLIDCSTVEGEDGDSQYQYTFMVYAKDVETAKEIIDREIDLKVKERAEKDGTEPVCVTTSIETATIVKCSQVISREFSLAYCEKESNI